MIEQIAADFFRVEVPLPNNPLKALNAYVVKGRDRHLVVDTGFHTEASRALWERTLAQLGIAFDRVDLVLTHLHADHTGLAFWFAARGAKLYASPVDGQLINRMTEEAYWLGFEKRVVAFGLDVDGVEIAKHPGYRYCPKERMEIHGIDEGDRLIVGNRSLAVVSLPGHTPGHIGLYCEAERWLIGGDAILSSITPNIAYWSETFLSLSTYFQTLERIAALPIDVVYAAHRAPVVRIAERVSALFQHHRDRLAEVEGLVGNHPLTAREIASRMTWDYRAKNWAAFPDAQKWFATSEAVSHLMALVGEGRLTRRTDGDRWSFQRAR